MDQPEANPYAVTPIEDAVRSMFSVSRGVVALAIGTAIGVTVGVLSTGLLPNDGHVRVTVALACLAGFASFAAYAPPSPHRLLRAFGVAGVIGIAAIVSVGGLTSLLFPPPRTYYGVGVYRERTLVAAGVVSGIGIMIWTFYVGRQRGSEVIE